VLKIIERIKQILYGNEERKAISSNISWLFAEKAVRFVLSFLVAVWVTRYLGPDRYGILSYTVAFVGILGIFIGFGLENILIRELVKQPELKDILLGNAFLLFLGSSLFCFLISTTVIYYFRTDDLQTIWLVVILSFSYLLKPFKIISLYFESKVQGKLFVPYTIIALVVTNLLKIYFVFNEESLYAFAWTMVIEDVIISLGLIHLYYSKGLHKTIRFRIDLTLTKSLLKDSLPLMFSAFMIVILMKIDQVMLREMVSATEVGLYSVAVTLASVWLFVPAIIVRSFFPKIVVAKKNDIGTFHKQVQQLYKLIAFIGYSVCIPITLFSNQLVLFLYGESFSEAGIMLSTLVWTGFFVGLTTVRESYIYTMNLTKQQLIITIMCALLNIGINLILIPIYQGFGAVLATLFCQAFGTIASSIFVKSLRSNGVMMLKAAINPNPFY